MVSPRLKRILHWAGSTLSVAGVVFVVIKLSEYSGQIDFSRFTYRHWMVLVALTIIYATANVFLSLAWKRLLQHFRISVRSMWAFRTYGVSQLAKYVPGNIFHLASRQSIGQAAGLPAWPLAKSAVWELCIISVTGAMFGILVLPYFIPAVSLFLATVTFLGVLTIVATGLGKFVGLSIAYAVGWYVLFLMVSGIIFVGLLTLLMQENSTVLLQASSLTGAFVVAWLAGLVTPGAPAGVGVREFVLMVLLKGSVFEPALLLAVLLGRFVTVGGDLLFFLIATSITRVEVN